MQNEKVNRRGFIKASIGGAVGAGLIPSLQGNGGRKQDSGEALKIRETRMLGRTGWRVSDIGFGAGGLTNANVLLAAMDMGVNYVDTAEHYGNGQSERSIGEALKNRDRKSIFITTKLNLSRGGNSKQEILDRFRRCLERLQTDYADCFMMHMVSSAEHLNLEGYHEAVKELKAEGKIRFTGLSNHGTEHRLAGYVLEPMEKVVMAAAEDGRFDVVLFVYNFIQKEQGERILAACRAKNMGVTLMKMNPVNFYSSIKGYFDSAKESGRAIPEAVVNLMKEYETWVAQADSFKERYGLSSENEIRDAAIRFVLSNPDVHSACPSINSFEELNAFVALSGQKLRNDEKGMLASYTGSVGRFYCRHACGICESVCPNRVPVNTIMRYNHYFEAQHREKHAMAKYAKLDQFQKNPCEGCSGPCVSACPHGVPIQGLLMLAHANLTLA